MPTNSAISAAANDSSSVAGKRSLSSTATWRALPQRHAEVALRGVADEPRELHVERLVEPELGAQPLPVLRSSRPARA